MHIRTVSKKLELVGVVSSDDQLAALLKNLAKVLEFVCSDI